MSVIELANSGSFFKSSLLPKGVIHWSEAKQHIDEYVTIYGEVASTYFNWYQYDCECERWAAYPDVEIKIPPTFIEIGAKYPNKELLKVVIWGRDRNRFEQSPDTLYRDKVVLIKGRPYMYNELVHVKVSNPADITPVDSIPNLYSASDSQTRSNPDYKAVFSNALDAEEDDGHRNDDGDWDNDYDYHDYDYHEYEDYYGRDVTQVGDYFYDDDGNCVPDVRERSPYEWHHRSYYDY